MVEERKGRAQSLSTRPRSMTKATAQPSSRCRHPTISAGSGKARRDASVTSISTRDNGPLNLFFHADLSTVLVQRVSTKQRPF